MSDGVLRFAYGSISLFIAILNNVFLLYYVEVFVSVYKIDRTSFWLGEVSCFLLFLVLDFTSKYPFAGSCFLFINNHFLKRL